MIVDVEEDNIKLSASQIGVTDPNNGSILRDTVIQVSVGEQPRAEIGESRGWEVLKSIVYGGLIESITSLGIVSSAVGSGAAPCKRFSFPHESRDCIGLNLRDITWCSEVSNDGWLKIHVICLKVEEIVFRAHPPLHV